jgi:hypothetical protein
MFVNPVFRGRKPEYDHEYYKDLQYKSRVLFVVQSVKGSSTSIHRDFVVKSAKNFIQREDITHGLITHRDLTFKLGQ